MRVGVKLWTEFYGMASLRRIFTSIHQALAARHELVFLPPEYLYVADAERARMEEDFLRGCDVVVGNDDAALAAARRRIGSRVPFVWFTMGDLPTGAWVLRRSVAAGLTSRDVLAVNCACDVEQAGRLFPNARALVIPFAFDGGEFQPMPEEERREARAAFGFGEDDRIVLYAGRITPEKNVQTLLRLFGAVHRRVPAARLVLAGSVSEGLAEAIFKVHSPRVRHTFRKAIAALDLPPGRVHHVDHAGGRRLRALYNVADVKVNLTLNPDENFGLAQVEAMACGTPVVGTAWGGLKDTVVDGVSGWRVTTVASPTGVKASWWEALNRIVALLEDGGARERFREACVRHAARYSQAAFAARLEELLCAAVTGGGPSPEPVEPTPLAEEFWRACDPADRRGAPFPRSVDLEARFREILAPYAGATAAHVPAGEALEPDQILSLATPLDDDGEDGVRVDHVLHPYRVEVPAAHLAGVRAILGVLREEPAIAAGELAARLADAAGAREALEWMIEAGLVLRTRPVAGWLAPAEADRRLAQVLFSVREIDGAATDLVVLN